MLRVLLLIAFLVLPLSLSAQFLPDSISNQMQIAQNLQNLALEHFNRGDINAAIRSLKESNRLLRRADPQQYADNLLTISGYYLLANDTRNSLAYLRLYSLEKQKSTENLFLNRMLELERLQTLEITALEEQRNQAQLESQLFAKELITTKKRLNLVQVIFIAVLILFVAGASIFIIYFRRKPGGQTDEGLDSEANETIQQLGKDVKDLKTYIQTGKYIASQLDSLDKTSGSLLKKDFPDLVYYDKPRIGSGSNFLWHSVKPDHAVIVVGQTNISGLNGSLISIMMKKILNHVIVKENITSPSMVMTLSDQKLRQYTGNESELAYIGSSLAYILIHRKTKEVEFAGAGLPLYYISGSKVKLFGSNLIPLANSFAQEKFFDTHTFSIRNGDYLCLSSSGIIDQIGHGEDKKFGRKSFIKLLESISGKRPSDQYYILDKVHMEWKGLKPQTDDVLVLMLKADNI